MPRSANKFFKSTCGKSRSPGTISSQKSTRQRKICDSSWKKVKKCRESWRQLRENSIRDEQNSKRAKRRFCTKMRLSNGASNNITWIESNSKEEHFKWKNKESKIRLILKRSAFSSQTKSESEMNSNALKFPSKKKRHKFPRIVSNCQYSETSSKLSKQVLRRFALSTSNRLAKKIRCTLQNRQAL